jgi:hypothetical protein
MNVDPAVSSPAPPQPSGKWRHRGQRVAVTVLGLFFLYMAAAYLAMPWMWFRYARRHPSLDDVPGITETKTHIPGDPLNVALIGTEEDVKQIMLAAKWYPADPLTLRSCWEIADATVLKRAYADAPVSNLYLYGRKEDLAFEQPVGRGPRQRHHVRFWRSPDVDADGRPVWVGAAVFDQHVGFSRTTGQITHVTAPDIDVERDYLFACLERTGELSERYVRPQFHKVLHGRNGGGDPWQTDGSLDVGVIGLEPR